MRLCLGQNIDLKGKTKPMFYPVRSGVVANWE